MVTTLILSGSASGDGDGFFMRLLARLRRGVIGSGSSAKSAVTMASATQNQQVVTTATINGPGNQQTGKPSGGVVAPQQVPPGPQGNPGNRPGQPMMNNRPQMMNNGPQVGPGVVTAPLQNQNGMMGRRY